jgi:hypothetical protein
MGIEQMLVVVIPFPLYHLFFSAFGRFPCNSVFRGAMEQWFQQSYSSSFFIYRVETTAQSRHSSAKFWSAANGGSQDLFPDGGQQSLAFFLSCQGFAGHRINHLQ